MKYDKIQPSCSGSNIVAFVLALMRGTTVVLSLLLSSNDIVLAFDD